MFHPAFGEVITVIEVLTVLTIIATALFGSQVLSERAFRLLRWFGSRPKPPAPGQMSREITRATSAPATFPDGVEFGRTASWLHAARRGLPLPRDRRGLRELLKEIGHRSRPPPARGQEQQRAAYRLALSPALWPRGTRSAPRSSRRPRG